jgi:predicted lipoprotein with Yx(FWY)xxD motif
MDASKHSPYLEEATVRHSLALGAVAATVALLAAGCGSSGKTTTTRAAATRSPYAAQTTSTSTSAATTGVAVVSKHGKPGVILAAGPKKLTVYLFEGDGASSSSCSGECAGVWPPVTSAGAPVAGAGVVAAHLGTITRPDGTKQVTYNGHPLYFYSKDGDSGDAYGQAIKSFGASWYVIAPSGNKVDTS